MKEMASLIYEDGVIVANVVKSDGTLGKGEARCGEEDTFRPEIGAIIALCRAFGSGVRSTCYDVIKAMNGRSGENRKHKVRVDMTGVQVGKARLGRGLLLADKSLPFSGSLRSFGTCGTKTNFHDVNGKPLFVGDLVIISRLEGCTRTGKKWVDVPDLHLVVDEDSDNEATKGQYIMGLCDACNPETGRLDRRFRVRKVKSWKEVEFGEVFDGGIRVTWDGSVEADYE